MTSFELTPWLADSYKFIDDNTLEVKIKDNINFSSGRKLDATAAKECFEDLLAVHDRAPKDMKISEIKDRRSNSLHLLLQNPIPH